MKILLMILPLLSMAVEPSLTGQAAMVRDPETVVSPGGTYCLSFQYGSGNTEYVPIDRFTVLTREGEFVYEKTGIQHTVLDISDHGIVVGIDFDGPVSGRGRLVFYDAAGQETGTATIGFMLGRTFSRDGSAYCVQDGEAGLRVFDTDGTQRYCLDRGNTFAVSYDGSRVAVTRDGSIAVYHNGVHTSTIPTTSPFVRQMGFSRDNTRFGFITAKTFTVYDLTTDARVFQYEETAIDRHFISCDVLVDDAGYICGLDEDGGRGAQNRHTTGYVYHFDEHGAVLWQDTLHYDTWYIHVPRVQTENEHSFSVSTADQVYHYEY